MNRKGAPTPVSEPHGVDDRGCVYVIVEVTVRDRDLFLAYARGHLPSVESHGGRILWRSFDLEPVEGDWRPECLVVHEWPSAQAFWDWWHSDDYKPWAEMRSNSADIKMVIARGSF